MLTTTDIVKKIVNSSAEISVEMTQEGLVDNFLDKVNVYRVRLVNMAQHIEKLSSILESISAVKEYTPDDSILIKFSLEMCNDLSKKLSTNYAKANRICKPNGILKNELAEYKMAISDFKETISDIHMAFFILPKDEEFQQLNNELTSLL